MSIISSLKRSASTLVVATALLTAPACSQSQQMAAQAAPAEEPAIADTSVTDTDAATPVAPADRADVVASVQENVTEETADVVNDSRKAVLQDAVEAIEHTEKALAALQSEDRETAIDELALAAGKLEIVLARDPDLALAPFDVTTGAQDVLVDVDTVRKLGRDIRELVDDRKFQEARVLMDTFGSELNIRTYALPLATYPEAIKDAAALLDDGDDAAATRILEAALNTIVVTDHVVPLPLLRAQAMMNLAEGILDGEVEVEGDRAERLASLQENAAYQVELAKAFGYGDRDTFKSLERNLKDLGKKIEDGDDAGIVFDTIRKQIDNLRAESGNE